MENNYSIRAFSLSGYRSFGNEKQRISKLSKINLFIGQNNCGKSNILRFIHDIYPTLSRGKQVQLNSLDRHLPLGFKFTVGLSIPISSDRELEFLNGKLRSGGAKTQAHGYLLSVLQEKCQLDGTEDVWFDFGEDLALISSGWKEAFNCLDDRQLRKLWENLTGRSGGGRDNHWYPESLRAITPSFESVKAVLIPAIRKVGEKGSLSDDFSGEGIIERLVRLQNPDVYSQDDRKKFDSINMFLRSVTGNVSAAIEIPHERDTILVHMDGKTLPLESLGTGIHEVIILASAATVLENSVICMEEPELHLNPILQKKLVRYLLSSTSNQYFITTHSTALMDTPEAEIYHISMQDGESKSRRVTSDKHKSEICGDLGYHPSDLLQSNCIIWVEGPSDRLYTRYWINSISPNLIEGIHYSIMFYGGKLASHLTGNDLTESVDDFISLRRLNRRSCIVIDSDRDKPRARINHTKKRLEEEFNSGPGFSWVTDGREIENYIDPGLLKEAIVETMPSAKVNSGFGKYENSLAIITKGGKEVQASKVDIARHITENTAPDLGIFDLKAQIKRLIAFIEESNPSMHVEA